ncbi:iron uptake porin [Trichormus azollae]|jgi:BMFP domain-containing protein YqiC|uniref:Carbohydrate-selective porin OprB n=1 Tax=Nostoc azollae (strain 0708) TaxID=551115 RepID=D7DXA5_NOSA0|nr:iron uptake porin [Trichormus azollae]ADI65824.1 Carbohydrate-selective porin OprB ['Nostoc azollae' 0708]
MQKFWAYLLASPAICGAMLSMGTGPSAGEVTTTTETSEPIGITNLTPKLGKINQQELISQVTSVSELSDVQSTDWAFQALRSLVERYGCIAGYANGTYRGNRAMTRYEFAAGLNACLDRVNELIATATADLVTKQDLATLQKLREEFAAELATLRGRVDALEARAAELEANQFSTTSKLQGQLVAVFSEVFAGNSGDNKNSTLGARARIEFVSSFSGQDTLFTRIESNNINSPISSPQQGNLFFAGSGTNDTFLGTLWYKFPVGNKTQAIAIATGGAADDLTSTINIFDGDGDGALSTFGTRNPIYNQISGAGLGVNHQFNKNITLSLGYLAGTTDNPASNPASKNGLFDGPYGAMAQLTLKPCDRIALGLIYINSYNQPILTGSEAATSDISSEAFSSNSYGLQASVAISEKFVLGGWAGYTRSQVLTREKGDVDIWNYAVTLGFPDLGKKGNLAGMILGMEPKVTSSSTSVVSEDLDTSYHIEAFYQYKISDNITITPGVIWITAPDHNDTNNNDVVIGALRTTFSF